MIINPRLDRWRTEMHLKNLSIQILQVATFCVLFGTGLAHLFGSQPYDQTLNQPASYQIISGTVFLVMSLICLLPLQKVYKTKLHFAFLIPSLLLLFHSFNALIKSGYVPEQMIEHALKIAVPVLLFSLLEFRNSTDFSKRFLFLLKLFTAVAFIGHAFFAVGVNYIPDNFYDMTTTILPLSHDEAKVFLQTVGILDIICAIALFTPLNRITIFYLIGWGLITAIARVWYGVLSTENMIGTEFFNYLGNTIYRLPHGIIPILILLLETRSNKKLALQ